MTIRKFIEDGVETFETQVEGETIQWDKGLSYARHLQIEQLLSAQVPVSDKPDEMLFIIMHQTMELWLKLILHEAHLVVTALQSDQVNHAIKGLDRIATIQRHMIHSWEVLATLTPHDYLTFRGYLRKASGFQSYQYRELEFLLGNKRESLLVFHREDEVAHNHLSRALQEPSLYDETLRLLARRGFSIPASHLNRDWSQPYEASEAIEDAWIAVYSDVEANWDLYTLAEKITGLEYYFQEWRFKHMKTVARVIGQKMGTAGSSGVNYLVKALDMSFFPELWSMRTRMTAPKAGVTIHMPRPANIDEDLGHIAGAATGNADVAGEAALALHRNAEIGAECPVNVGAIETPLHAGTHADAPFHYDAQGLDSAECDLGPYVGPCVLLDVRHAQGRVQTGDVDWAVLGSAERVIFRTYERFPADRWDADFTAIAPAVIARLREAGVRLVGTDAASLDPQNSKTMDAHHAIQAGDMRILEGLVLDDVPAGRYELIALPLKIARADASPVRAILREMPL